MYLCDSSHFMNTQQAEKTAAGVAGNAMPQVAEAKGLPRAQREHVQASSGDVVKTQVGKLRRQFPEVFVEGTIDFDKLRTTLGSAAAIKARGTGATS
jgi:hypothetical protein